MIEGWLGIEEELENSMEVCAKEVCGWKKIGGIRRKVVNDGMKVWRGM